MAELGVYQARESQEMEAFRGLRQALIITGKAAKMSHPSVAMLNDPVTGQQHIARLCAGELDDFELDTVLSNRRSNMAR